VAEPVYFDTSIFLEIVSRRSKYTARLRELLKELQEKKSRVYTSILTVQELSVSSYRKGEIARDTMADIRRIARVYSPTKEMALTAAKLEAQLKDIAQAEADKRDKRKPETEEQKLERICENRRRKWDCFHIATAQVLGCSVMYATDTDLQKRPKQLGIKSLKIVPPPEEVRRVTGPLLEHAEKQD
jgi:predicted nucleic acid-binding protein